MKQTSSLTRSLTDAQEKSAEKARVKANRIQIVCDCGHDHHPSFEQRVKAITEDFASV